MTSKKLPSIKDGSRRQRKIDRLHIQKLKPKRKYLVGDEEMIYIGFQEPYTGNILKKPMSKALTRYISFYRRLLPDEIKMGWADLFRALDTWSVNIRYYPTVYFEDSSGNTNRFYVIDQYTLQDSRGRRYEVRQT